METRSGVFAVAITVLLLMALTMNSVSAESKAKVKLGPSDADKMKLNHTDRDKMRLNHSDVAKWWLNHSDVAKEKLNHSDVAKVNLNYTDVAKMALNPSESMPFPTERVLNELIYDDGTAEDAYAWDSAGNGFAVQFTPPTYPVDLRTARICFWPDWPDSNHEEFAVYVYDDDGPGGEPGTCLGGPIYHTATAWGWCNIDISGLGITIEDGDFYILYKQLTDGPDCEGLCRDLSLPQYGRSWDYYYDGSWDLWNENYMIRCVVDDDTTDCGDMNVNPTSWSPTISCGDSDDEIVTVSATDNIVNGVTVSRVSGPTWLSVSQTDLGDIASGSSKTFTITASPPSGTSGDFPYTITVSNTCGTPSTRDVTGTIHVDCPESSWTFMVYLDGDNNLEGAAIDDFMEMSSVGSSPTVNIVVQFDRIPGYVSSYGDWTTCKRFRVTSGMTPMPANAISDLGECNMGDPNTLREFVEWAMTNFTADNYALILWNHGDGWKSIDKWVPWADDIKDAKDAGLSRGICVDNTNNDYLSLQETEVALTGKYVQLLGYDACLMHMIEVVYQVRNNAGVSVGSEEVEPWDGWPYDTILSALTGTPTMSEDTLGTVIVDRYMGSYGYTGSETQSAMDNALLPGLATAVDNLAQALMTEINAGHVAEVQQARNAAEEIYYPYYIDLYHFAEKVDTHVPGAAAEAQALMNEVSWSMYEAHGTSVPNDHGLSIYFPRVEGDYLASYDNTAFASDTEWNEFLKKYYNPPTQGDDIAIFSAPLWFVDTTGNHNADQVFCYGFAGTTPLVGDINQDGTDDIAIVGAYGGNYRWFVDTNGDHVADEDFWFGFAGAIPLVGDINQDGTDDIAIVGAYGGNYMWFVDTNGDHVADKVFWFGFEGAIPLVGDIDQDGTDDIAIVGAYGGNYRWFVDTNGDHVVDDDFWFGFEGAIPLVGDINQDGTDDIAVVGEYGGNYRWFVDTNFDKTVDETFWFGFAGAIPLVGDMG